MTLLYLYCRCSPGDGTRPVLSFADTSQDADMLSDIDLGHRPLVDRPLVFANACATAAADVYLANQLESTFFDRGCRGYLGTETYVPVRLASRFASTFFHYFYRLVDPAPMAAGEAVTQARLFLWSQYRNIGGLFYSYVNKWDLYAADREEVAGLR